MPSPVNRNEFFDLVRRSGVLEAERLDSFARSMMSDSGSALDQPQAVAARMVRDGLLTTFQAKQLLQGKWRRFLINGKYKLLELIGSGGMGQVYLCEHIFMRRLVALKVLPVDKFDDPSAVERFYREARAAGALDHPNIVRAHDIDKDEKVHYLVMEYVDGSSLQEIVARHGAMDPVRAAHYIRQAALGLQHAHEAGLVHRDIKPGNLLLDRSGTVKMLDLGLARFFNAHKDNITEQYDDKAILGTADYLAPEQALGKAVDIRADVYGLGGTFYFLITGKAPFEDGTITQKLLWHQTRAPKSILEHRPGMPEGMVAVIERMIAKAPEDRYETPLEVAEALKPWTDQTIPPPPTAEMPRRSPASLAPGTQGGPVMPITPPRVDPGTVLDRSLATNMSGNSSRSPARPTATQTASRTATTPATTATRSRVTPAPAPQSVRRTAQAVAEPIAETSSGPSARTLILAAGGGAVAVFLIVGVILFAVSGRGDKQTGGQPQPPQPPSKGVTRGHQLPPPPPGTIIPAERAAQFIGQRCMVEMVVARSGIDSKSGRYFLNSKVDYRSADNFTITFTKEVADKLRVKFGAEIQSYLEGKKVRITGTIAEYSGRAEIVLDDPSHIQIVNG